MILIDVLAVLRCNKNKTIFAVILLLCRALIIWTGASLWAPVVTWASDNIVIVSSTTVSVAYWIMVAVVDTRKELNFLKDSIVEFLRS